MSSSRDRLIERLKNFAYRHAWVKSHITNGIASQVRALRKARDWDQRRLAEVALGNGDLQSMISRYENPDYGKYSLRTLLDLAKAFDVGLVVRFAPFSEIMKWESNLLNSDIVVPSFESEIASGAFHKTHTGLQKPILTANTAFFVQTFYRPDVLPTPGTVDNKQIIPSGIEISEFTTARPRESYAIN